MEKNKKYALLDTDFIYKCHLARNFKEDTLAELVLDFEEYEFFCHEMIKEELSRKEIDPNPNPWLELKVQTGKIRLYSDQDIVNKLSKIYGSLRLLCMLIYFGIAAIHLIKDFSLDTIVP